MPQLKEKIMCFKSTRKKIDFLESRSYEEFIHKIVDQHFFKCMLAFGFQFTRGRLNKDAIQLCMRLS